jgi:uncharacterized SAM-binding protein YcdF (DUF218 family)
VRTFVRLALVAVVVAAGVFALREPLLWRLGAFLVVRDADAPSDAIVVLAGSLPDRILHGVDLHRAGLAPIMVLTRETEWPGLEELRARGIEIPERFELNRDIARQLGVPEEALVLIEQRANSTLTEVEALLPELRRRGIRSILLVTSKTHTRRAALIFATLSGGDIAVRVSPTPYDPFTPDGWWRRRVTTRRVLTEYGKWLTFVLVDRWRLQPLAAER